MAMFKDYPYTGKIFTGEKLKETTMQHQYNRVGDRIVEVREITVYSFSMGDVEDPVLYAGKPLYDWQESESGKWVMEHAVETPSWHRIHSPMDYSHRFVIRARLTAKDITFFHLKWGEVK